jgi:tetratricopeptide (TPR) repeat protein
MGLNWLEVHMVSNEEIKEKNDGINKNGYLVCDTCQGSYELEAGEKPEDFSSECECGGNLRYIENSSKPKSLGLIVFVTLMGIALVVLPLSDFIRNHVVSYSLDTFMIFFGFLLIMLGVYNIRTYSYKISLPLFILFILAAVLLNNIIVYIILTLTIIFLLLFFNFRRQTKKFNNIIELADKGFYQEAFDCSDKYLKLNSNDPLAFASKAYLFRKNSEYGKALKFIDNALELELNYKTWPFRNSIISKMLFIKGSIFFNSKKYGDALEYANKSLKLNKNSYFSWNLKGVILCELGNYEESIICLDKEINNRSSKGNGLTNKSEVLRRLGNYEQSIKCINKALKFYPIKQFIWIWIIKGQVEEKLRNYEESTQSYYKVIELCSRKDHVELQSALEASDRALEFNSEDAGLWLCKGVILGNLRKYNKSLKFLDNSLTINHDLSPAWYYRGTILTIFGKHQEAIECFDKVLDIDPDFELAKQAKEEILLISEYEIHE